MYYSIQMASELTGLSSHCIRAWEKRYGVVKPKRASGGRRLYSESEVVRLTMLARLSLLGNSISLIANLSDPELEKLLEKMGQGSHRAPETKVVLETESCLHALFMALHAYNLDILTHELKKASLNLSNRDLVLEIVAPLIRKVGEKVAEGSMSVAQEHSLSALIKFFLGRKLYEKKETGTHRKKIALATPPGERHSLGLILAGLLIAEKNMEVIYLGEDLPVESISEASRATGSDIVLLGASPAYSLIGDLNAVSLQLKELLPEETALWIGGTYSQLTTSTKQRAQITTFPDLYSLEKHLLQLARLE